LPFYETKDDPANYNNFLLHRYEKGSDVPASEVINIFGHCVFDEVIQHESFYAIDTGCVYGKKLTALELGSMEIIQEAMDSRDSDYKITELELCHLELSKHTHDLYALSCHIDDLFCDFDVVSNEVVAYIADNYGEVGKEQIALMLEKKQIFIKQAKKFLDLKDI
jgi:hypothetical protein